MRRPDGLVGVGEYSVWRTTWWTAMAVVLVLGGGVKANAEIYLWTDAHGVVHMTDQWANVPESARSHVSVRASTPLPGAGTPVGEPAMHPGGPTSGPQPPLWMPPALVQTPPIVAPSPPVLDSSEESWRPSPNPWPLVHHPKKVTPPFPYNVQLDPIDRNFVWVGRNRVPKDVFTYPRISLDAQAQFRNRIRALEQRRSAPRATFPTRPARP
jgi:hypothetical protein